METKKIILDGLEGKTLEVATAFNALADNYVELEKKTADISEIKSLKEKVAELEKVEVKSYDSEITALKKCFDCFRRKSKQTIR